MLVIRDVFTQVYEREDCENITIKLSFFKYDPDTDQIQDLLINSKFNLKLLEDNINEVYPEGASEIIVNNLKTAIKLIK